MNRVSREQQIAYYRAKRAGKRKRKREYAEYVDTTRPEFYISYPSGIFLGLLAGVLAAIESYLLTFFIVVVFRAFEITALPKIVSIAFVVFGICGFVFHGTNPLLRAEVYKERGYIEEYKFWNFVSKTSLGILVILTLIPYIFIASLLIGIPAAIFFVAVEAIVSS